MSLYPGFRLLRDLLCCVIPGVAFVINEQHCIIQIWDKLHLLKERHGTNLESC
jgi:hypothetical protein